MGLHNCLSLVCLTNVYSDWCGLYTSVSLLLLIWQLLEILLLIYLSVVPPLFFQKHYFHRVSRRFNITCLNQLSYFLSFLSIVPKSKAHIFQLKAFFQRVIYTIFKEHYTALPVMGESARDLSRDHCTAITLFQMGDQKQTQSCDDICYSFTHSGVSAAIGIQRREYQNRCHLDTQARKQKPTQSAIYRMSVARQYPICAVLSFSPTNLDAIQKHHRIITVWLLASFYQNNFKMELDFRQHKDPAIHYSDLRITVIKNCTI